MRLVALALVTACGGDLDLDVTVKHPAGATLARTTVTVYESPTLTCVDVAFSRIGPDELEALQIAALTVSRTGERTGALTGISRTDHKVIVARGYAEDGAWLTAGCAEQDVVREDTRIEISTMPTVSAALVLDTDPSDSSLAVIATTDATGRAVAGRRVAWTVYGPAGSLPATTTNVLSPADGVWEPEHASCTKASGAAFLHPPPPDIVGGYAVQLAAEWATALPPRYSRLNVSFAGQVLTPPAGSRKFCAIRRKGTLQRLVCLDGTAARDFEVTVSAGTPSLAQRGIDASIGAEPMNVVAVPSGDDRDVYVVTTRGLLIPVFGAPAADNSAAPCFDGSCVIDDVLAVPPCGATAGKLLMQVRGSKGPGQIKQLGVRGGSAQDFPLGTIAAAAEVALDNAGCVTRADLGGGAPTLRQVITYHVGARNLLGELVPIATRAAYACTTTMCATNELLPGGGVAFSADSESRMIASAIDATGVVLTELVMAPQPDSGGGRDVFVERSRIPSAAVPEHLIGGQFDGDGARDLFWNISSRRGNTFEVAYARSISGQPLSALSGVQILQVLALDAGDLTGDGFDDIVATSSLDLTTSGVVVVPAGARAPAVSVPVDAACP